MKRQKQKKRQGCGGFCLLSAGFYLYLLCMGISSVNAEQATYQSHDSILEASRNYIREKTSESLDTEPNITVNRLDTRLLLPECMNELETCSSPTEKFIGHSTVGVRCTAPRPWTIYVQAHITAYTDALIATRGMRRGDQLSASDFTLKRLDLSSLPRNYLDQPEQAKGLILKRTIQRGTVLVSSILEAPKLVRRGQKVSLLAVRNGIQVRSRGQSLSDGVSGQRVQVKNLRSKRIIEGIVIDKGIVEVIL